MISYRVVKGSIQFTAETATGARGLARLFHDAPLPAHRHRVVREAVVIPARFVDEALARLEAAGYLVEEQQL